MVAVAVGPDDIAEYLTEYVPKGVELSAVNDPGNCVVAGPKEPDSRVHPTPQRAWDSRTAGARDPRVSFQLDGSHAAGIPRNCCCRQQLRAPRTPLLEQPHRNLDVEAAGNRSGHLGAPNQFHDQVGPTN